MREAGAASRQPGRLADLLAAAEWRETVADAPGKSGAVLEHPVAALCSCTTWAAGW